MFINCRTILVLYTRYSILYTHISIFDSGSGTHGSHGHSKGTVCSCNAQSKSLLLGHALPSKQMAKYWPFKKIKKLFYGYVKSLYCMKNTFIGDSDSDSYLQYVHRFYFRYKEGVAGGRGESVGTNSGYTHQIAEIQHKQRKTKRHASVSSDNFSSSRSASCPPILPHLHTPKPTYIQPMILTSTSTRSDIETYLVF